MIAHIEQFAQHAFDFAAIEIWLRITILHFESIATFVLQFTLQRLTFAIQYGLAFFQRFQRFFFVGDFRQFVLQIHEPINIGVSGLMCGASKFCVVNQLPEFC